MSHELYVQVLSAMFLFWNGARVLTYIPTIGKLLAREADVRSYSLLSWGCWALSNGTFALMLLDMSRGTPDRMFWMNLANTLMCLVVSFINVLRRFPRLSGHLTSAYQKIRRNGPARGAVSAPGALRHRDAGGPNAGTRLEGYSARAATPWRIGPRTLRTLSASALAVGVAGTFAYGVASNQDQPGYVAATASAPPLLKASSAASPTQQTSSSSEPALPPPPPARVTPVAHAGLAAPASSPRFDRNAPRSADAGTPHAAKAQVHQASYVATPNRQRSEPHAAPNPFTRVRQFFRHISYRLQGAASKRDDHGHR